MLDAVPGLATAAPRVDSSPSGGAVPLGRWLLAGGRVRGRWEGSASISWGASLVGRVIMPCCLVRMVSRGLSWVFVLSMGFWVVYSWVVCLELLVLAVCPLLPLASNARFQLPLEAGATKERTL